MATTTTRARNGTAGGKLVSVASWCVAVWTTTEFIRPMSGLPQEATASLLLWAALIQAVMTWGESPIWKAQGTWWNYGVLVIDVVTNVGGLFFFITRLDQTDSWRAFNQGLGTTGSLNSLAALFVSLVLGVMIAAAPEYLWRKG